MKSLSKTMDLEHNLDVSVKASGIGPLSNGQSVDLSSAVAW